MQQKFGLSCKVRMLVGTSHRSEARAMPPGPTRELEQVFLEYVEDETPAKLKCSHNGTDGHSMQSCFQPPFRQQHRLNRSRVFCHDGNVLDHADEVLVGIAPRQPGRAPQMKLMEHKMQQHVCLRPDAERLSALCLRRVQASAKKQPQGNKRPQTSLHGRLAKSGEKTHALHAS